MKRLIYVLMSVFVLMSAYSCSSEHYVATQPEEVVVTRPVSPGPNYVWVDGDYYWSGGRYVYRQGYWARPRGTRAWVVGGWNKGPRGYYWRRGHWQ